MSSVDILQVITDTDRRGAQVFAADLEHELVDAGLVVSTFAIAPGTKGAQLPIQALGRSRFDLSALRALRKQMRGARVVVAHGSGTLIATTLAGIGLRPLLVYRNISDPAYWLRNGARRLRVKLMLKRATKVVALWTGGANYLVRVLGIEEDRVVVIPNGVHTDSFRPPSVSEKRAARAKYGFSADHVVLLFVAAFQTEKHPETAVATLDLLPEKFRLLMLGDGPCLEPVSKLAQAAGGERVVIPGRVDKTQHAYWAADILVLPSEGEGLPAVLIEAGLSGLPAVASDSGGNEDIVLDGMTGFVVPPASPKALADGVTRILSEGKDFGANARAHCLSRYDMRSVGRAWVDLLTGWANVTGSGSTL